MSLLNDRRISRRLLCLAVCTALLCASTIAYAVPRFVGSSRLFEIAQEGLFSRQAPAVERVETAASFYDFYSASSHTGFEYTRRSLVFLYRDLRDEGNLSIFFLHGVDDTGQAAHLRQPYGEVRGCIRGIPAGARVAVSDDNTREFDWSTNCNGRPTNNGNIARGYWAFGNNTDGGAIDRIRTDVDWEISVEIELEGAMDEWRYFMADGADIVLDLNRPLLIRSRANNAGDSAESAEGESMTVCALAMDDDNPPHLTYTFNWNDGSEADQVQLPPAELACQDHVFPDSGDYNIRIDVADPAGRGVSKNFRAVMQPAPPRLYADQDATATTEIPALLSVRAEDGLADTHRSRWDFNNDGRWDTDWVEGVQTAHTFANQGQHTVRVEVIDNEDMSATTEFTVDVALRVPQCGDGVLDAGRGEVCDDGNDDNRDPCGNNCQPRPESPEIATSEPCVMRNGVLRCPTIEGALGDTGPQPVVIDLSASVDPDSREPLRFQYAVAPALGRITPGADFANDRNNMGPIVEYVPTGDGLRVDTITVQVFDSENNQSTASIPIQIPNTPPSIDNWDVRFAPPPFEVGDAIQLENLGRRRYRATVNAQPAQGTGTVIEYRTSERFDEPVTVTADMNADGRDDLSSAEPDGVIGPFVHLQDGNTPLTVSVSDGEDTVSQTRNVVVPQMPVPRQDEIRFFIDVGNDGAFEATGNITPSVEFFVPGGMANVTIAGFVRSPGGTTHFEYDVTLPNSNPRLTIARVVSVTGFDVVITSSATDLDGDPLTYVVDWGDGTVTRSRGVVSRHRYPAGVFRSYNINVSVDDARGGSSSRRLEVAFEEPEIRDAEISSLAWERLTETEGSYDGVRTFDIAPDGVIISHNYMDQLRRSTDGGENWVTVMENVECCGMVAARDPNQFVAATPGGLFYTEDNGDNWALWDDDAFKGAVISPDRSHFVAATADEVRRYDLTGGLVDTFAMDNEEEFNDMEACESRSGMTTRNGTLYINDTQDLDPAGWNIPDERFGKGNGESSISFDKECNLYQGLWNGYRMLKINGEVVPSSTKAPKNQVHVAGYHPKNIYQGTGSVTDIMAWPGGPYVVGAIRGVWAEEESWNAYRKPYWKAHTRGLDRSRVVRKFQLHPVNGHLYLSTSSAVQVPKYCRKARRGNRRRRRRRRRRARVQYYYVFCGFNYHYYGGMYRSTDPLLSSRVVGNGGRAFDDINANGTAFSPQQGGLVVSLEEEDTGYMWLPNTAESTMSKWDPSTAPPRELGRYRVGLPQGECPGSCCWDDGCNMPSRVGIDGHGDAYVANRGFAMQGTVTKIAARIEDCVDRNNNGQIETSTGPNALAYGADECVLWTANAGAPGNVLRALAIDLGDAQEPDGYVWVGGYNNRKMWKMHPDDGRILGEYDVNVQPYGAIATADGNLWLSTLGEGRLQSINTRTGDVNAVVENPQALRGCASSYGIGLDHLGRIWMNGWSCPDAIAYDPRDDTWCRMGLAFPDAGGNNMTVGRGITVDAAGRMWAAIGGDGQSHVAWWSAEDCVAGQSNDVPQNQLLAAPANTTGPSAVGADLQGKIWLAHKDSQRLVRIDPDNNFAMDAFAGTNRVYSYSDFTGVVRRLGVGRGSYVEDFQASCNAPTWTDLTWRARVPNGARLNFVAYTAQDRDKLDEASPVAVATVPGDDAPIDVGGALEAAGVAPRTFLRLRVNFVLNGENESPVLETFAMRWSCE